MLVDELVLYSGWAAKYLAALFLQDVALLFRAPQLHAQLEDHALHFNELGGALLLLARHYRLDPLVQAVRRGPKSLGDFRDFVAALDDLANGLILELRRETLTAHVTPPRLKWQPGDVLSTVGSPQP